MLVKKITALDVAQLLVNVSRKLNQIYIPVGTQNKRIYQTMSRFISGNQILLLNHCKSTDQNQSKFSEHLMPLPKIKHYCFKIQMYKDVEGHWLKKKDFQNFDFFDPVHIHNTKDILLSHLTNYVR